FVPVVAGASSGSLSCGTNVEHFFCRAAAFSPDGTLLAAGGNPTWIWDHQIQLLDTGSIHPIATISHPGAKFPALSPDGSRFFTGSWFGDLAAYDIDSGEILNRVRAHNDTIRAVEISPDGKWLITVAEDGAARLWDAVTLREAGGVPKKDGDILCA